MCGPCLLLHFVFRTVLLLYSRVLLSIGTLPSQYSDLLARLLPCLWSRLHIRAYSEEGAGNKNVLTGDGITLCSMYQCAPQRQLRPLIGSFLPLPLHCPSCSQPEVACNTPDSPTNKESSGCTRWTCDEPNSRAHYGSYSKACASSGPQIHLCVALLWHLQCWIRDLQQKHCPLLLVPLVHT